MTSSDPDPQPQPKILLATINAKYHHTSFGLRYLLANMGSLQDQTQILEFTLAQNPRDIAESILARNPRIVGFGVYIWNTDQTLAVVSVIKKLRPEIVVVLGGPEVSYESESQPLCQLADLTIKGEADHLFREFCESYLATGLRPSAKFLSGELPDIQSIQLPYSQYTDEDVSKRYIYVEASRGCPYKCEYCLSSLDKSVRNFPLDAFLAEMDTLIKRGARQFKFVDRTFNLSIAISTRILQFFLDRSHLGLFLHFEMVPDRLPLELRTMIQKFPKGALQFEIGIQTWNPAVSALVSRRQDYTKIRENFHFLTQNTHVHIHADLIVGLPGETIDSFAKGFDELYRLKPHEIQVGILKRLKGTPIIRHDQEWEMVYQEQSPFQILKTKTIDFESMQSMVRFAHFWNLYANSGNFKDTMALFQEVADQSERKSLFWIFYDFSKFLHKRHPQGHGVALLNLVESAWIYFNETKLAPIEKVKAILLHDYNGYVKRDVPLFLKDESERQLKPKNKKHLLRLQQSETNQIVIPKRQKRHLQSAIEAKTIS